MVILSITQQVGVILEPIIIGIWFNDNVTNKCEHMLSFIDYIFTLMILLHLFQALEAEIQAHEPVINTVNSRAQQMIRSVHFAAGEVENKIKHLLSRLSMLKDTASVRRLRLLDAVESQMVSLKCLLVNLTCHMAFLESNGSQSRMTELTFYTVNFHSENPQPESEF